MSVDKSWRLLTEVYAVVAVVGLLATVAACIWLVLKIRGTVREVRRQLVLLSEHPRRTAAALREASRVTGGRARRVAELARASARKAAAVVRAIGS